MKKLLACVTLSLCTVGLAAVDSRLDPERLAALQKRRAAAVQARGGIVSKPVIGNYLRFVSTQQRVGLDALKKLAKEANARLDVNYEVLATLAGKCPLEDVEVAMKQPKSGAVIMLVDDKKLPMIVAAPENAWAILNVARIYDDFPPEAVANARLVKELKRALAAAFYTGQSMDEPSLTQPVYSIVDLDSIPATTFHPETQAKILTAARKRNIGYIKMATYDRACAEGWAPEPTNDVQKAIWEKAHQLPTNPLPLTKPTK